MKLFDVSVDDGKYFYIFSCKDEINFLDLSSEALYFVIYLEKD